MKFKVLFSAFLVILLAENGECKDLFINTIKDFIFPRNPQVHRVRRMEDANGDPFAVLDTVGLVEQHGYPGEQHNLTTDDGYNLVFFRVPGSPKSPPAPGKPAVFLQHGAGASSDTWVFLRPEQSLGFVLADAGYDVWIGNIRGNTYCRSHVNLTTADKEFWDHSWHEMGIYDIPNMIDYILEHTKQKSLYHIGHSMGTTTIYVLLSERPEYNDKIRLSVCLAPAAAFTYTPNLLYRSLSALGNVFNTISETLEVYDIAPQTKTNVLIFKALCGAGRMTQSLCLTSLIMGCGQPHDPLNMTLLTYLVKYCPAGISVKAMVHYQQCLHHVLPKYDYGPSKNMKLYGSKTPPSYDWSKISAPVALIYGNTDTLGLEQNIRTIANLLPNVATMEAVPERYFNHLDFIISPVAKERVYDRIVELLSKY